MVNLIARFLSFQTTETKKQPAICSTNRTHDCLTPLRKPCGNLLSKVGVKYVLCKYVMRVKKVSSDRSGPGRNISSVKQSPHNEIGGLHVDVPFIRTL
jgi:hypothetical protein